MYSLLMYLLGCIITVLLLFIVNKYIVKEPEDKMSLNLAILLSFFSWFMVIGLIIGISFVSIEKSKLFEKANRIFKGER